MELNPGCGVGAFHHTDHTDHVRLAWSYAGGCDAKKAEERLLAGIRRFAAQAGVPEKFQYTTTVGWSRLVAASRKNSKAENTFGE